MSCTKQERARRMVRAAIRAERRAWDAIQGAANWRVQAEIAAELVGWIPEADTHAKRAKMWSNFLERR